jgi:flagellar hook-basal body complex protein FliE
MPGPIQPVTPVAMPGLSGAASRSSRGGFQDALAGAIQEVEARGQEAGRSIEQFLSGEGELHTTALAAQRAELAFDLFLQARNKVVQAYQEIMRMPM